MKKITANEVLDNIKSLLDDKKNYSKNS